MSRKTATLRVSPAIAFAWESRGANEIPSRLYRAGEHELTFDELARVRADLARFATRSSAEIDIDVRFHYQLMLRRCEAALSKAPRRKAACAACGRVVAVRFKVQVNVGGKARVRHLCPHGNRCIGGVSTHGFNRNTLCRECLALPARKAE